MLPITTGIIPFGLVMGSVASSAHLSAVQTLGMNCLVFAGASQLAAIDLMLHNTPSLIVVLTGMTINLRFLLYSASLSSVFHESSVSKKAVASYVSTDQTYAVLMAQRRHMSNQEKASFYLGSAVTMVVAWQSSVLIGFLFGNFAPHAWSLDYAVPLSFVALVIPTLKDKTFVLVALASAVISVLLKPLPWNLGLVVTALLGISLGALLTRNRGEK